MTNDAETALDVLVGASLVGSRRIVDMQTFGFGDLVVSPDPRARGRLIPEYELHVQCPWRIVRSERIVVGYRDLEALPPRVPGIKPNPADSKVTVRDRLVDQFLAERVEQPRRVTECFGTILGDVRLTLDDDCVLELFPDASSGDSHTEFWRLLLPDDRHVVMSASGLGLLPPLQRIPGLR